MSDLLNEVNYLRFYHTAQASVRDKDTLKNEYFKTYTDRVSALMMFPTVLQFWQISLTGVNANLSLYRKVRFFKTVSLAGAFAIGAYEMHKLDQKWTYYNRFYPEPTELQKTIDREAFMMKEQQTKEVTVQERMDAIKNPDTQQRYSQFYSLGPQQFPEGEDKFNAAEHKEHH